MQPTAELRPPAAGQTDEDDLMPYRVLDAIERAAIRDKQPPVEVFRTIRPQFPQYTAAQLRLWVERFFRLWCRNQWKRERYAPSFHLDDENLDPKTWCRFPILSGGFERELGELSEYVPRSRANRHRAHPGAMRGRVGCHRFARSVSRFLLHPIASYRPSFPHSAATATPSLRMRKRMVFGRAFVATNVTIHRASRWH